MTAPSRAAIAALPNGELQQLLGEVARAYAERVLESGTDLAPFAPDALSATEALVVAGQILRAAEISSFELASILNI